MPQTIFHLRELPRYETLRAQAQRYPGVDPDAVNVFIVLSRVASDILADRTSHLATRGLSQARFTVLMILNRHPAARLSAVDIARKMGVTRATMTGLLDGLARDGLVVKQADAADRRKLTIRLTAKARKNLDATLPGFFAWITSAMAALDAREKKLLVGLLAKLGQNLQFEQETPDDRPPPGPNGRNHPVPPAEITPSRNTKTVPPGIDEDAPR